MKSRNPSPTSRAFARLLGALHPAQIVVAGYLIYMLAGFALLSLPIEQQQPVAPLDNLLSAVSAVSTTGLVTVDPGSSYSFFGEIVLAALMQAGGVGYMTVGSFIVLSISHQLTQFRQDVIRTASPLPADFSPAKFLRTVIAFTLICEAAGAAAL